MTRGIEGRTDIHGDYIWTRFNYRFQLISYVWDSYNFSQRKWLATILKVYQLRNVEGIEDSLDYEDVYENGFWDNITTIRDLKFLLNNRVNPYSFDSDTQTYHSEYKLNNHIHRKLQDIEDWFYEVMYSDEYRYCEGCDDYCSEDNYYGEGYCHECNDRYEEENEEYHDEDEGYYAHERYCKNYTYPVQDFIEPQCREDESIDTNLDTTKDLLYGVELEVMARNSMEEDFPETLQYNNDWFVCKRDGSLDEGNGGFEITTAPCTYKFLKDRFSQMFNSNYWTDDNGSTYVKGWNTNCAGLHIHINKKALTPLEIGKLLVFVNDKKNARFIEDIAGRTMGRWCASKTKKISDGQYRSDDRYEAVNTVPSKTVELRIFKSNVSEHGFMRALEFTDGLIQYLKQSSMREQSLNYKSFISYIKKPENRSEYSNFWSWLITNGYALGTPSRNVSKQFDNVSNG